MPSLSMMQLRGHGRRQEYVDVATKQLSKGGGEVQEMAREIAREEQYWILADRSEPRKPPKDYNYVEELAHLQIELIKMQECGKSAGNGIFSDMLPNCLPLERSFCSTEAGTIGLVSSMSWASAPMMNTRNFCARVPCLRRC
jgi:hypothetical protein